MENRLKILIVIILCYGLFEGQAVFAQGLPDVQQLSLRIPVGLKIDGKADEWNNKFQAYNPATDLYYNIANDEKYLYLIVQTNINGVIDRISGGGVTLAIANKNTKNSTSVSITYPARTDRLVYMFASYAPKRGDTTAASAITATKRKNDVMENLSKWIKVTGVNTLDTIPIYNEAGIETAGKFDINKNFTIEMKIPLSLLTSEIGNSNGFSYQVRVNGGRAMPPDIEKEIEWNSPMTPEQQAQWRRTSMKRYEERFGVYNSTTDFWGEYTLAK